MTTTNGMSRRTMLTAAAAASGIAAIGGAHAASWRRTPNEIDQFAPELEKIISTSEPIKELASGLAATRALTKGRCGGRRAAICCSAISITTGA